MSSVISLAKKDLLLIKRDKVGFFFTYMFPCFYCVIFGLIMQSMMGGGGTNKIKVAIADDDNTPESKRFVERLTAADEIELIPAEFEQAKDDVRRGKYTAVIRLPEGFGQKIDQMFTGDSAELQIGLDPTRQAEAGMLQGILLRTAFEGMEEMFTDPVAMQKKIDGWLEEANQSPDMNPAARAALNLFLPALGSFTTQMTAAADEGEAGEGDGGGFAMEPLVIKKVDVQRKKSKGPSNAYDISFPQGIVWGVMGCAAGFGISLVQERTGGTLVRLTMSPITKMQILGGKALACLSSIVAMMTMVFLLGAFGFDVRPNSYVMLLMAAVSVAICFAGIMMVMSVLGKTEQSAGGLGWGILIVMAMFGGGMFPLIAMPGWMLTVSNFSPVKWSILAMEGAVWREFTFTEMLPVCGILLGIGVACFLLGSRLFQWSQDG